MYKSVVQNQPVHINQPIPNATQEAKAKPSPQQRQQQQQQQQQQQEQEQDSDSDMMNMASTKSEISEISALPIIHTIVTVLSTVTQAVDQRKDKEKAEERKKIAMKEVEDRIIETNKRTIKPKQSTNALRSKMMEMNSTTMVRVADTERGIKEEAEK